MIITLLIPTLHPEGVKMDAFMMALIIIYLTCVYGIFPIIMLACAMVKGIHYIQSALGQQYILPSHGDRHATTPNV